MMPLLDGSALGSAPSSRSCCSSGCACFPSSHASMCTPRQCIGFQWGHAEIWWCAICSCAASASAPAAAAGPVSAGKAVPTAQQMTSKRQPVLCRMAPRQTGEDFCNPSCQLCPPSNKTHMLERQPVVCQQPSNPWSGRPQLANLLRREVLCFHQHHRGFDKWL